MPRRVYEGVRDLPGVRFRRLPDPAGEIGTGVFLGFTTKEQRERYRGGDEGGERAGGESGRFGGAARSCRRSSTR